LTTGGEFLEASKACGAGPVRSLLRVLLPMTRTGIVAAATLTFVLLSHEFSASMMVRSVRTQVMGSVFYDALSSGGYPEAAVLAIVMVIVTLIGVLIAVGLGGVEALKKM
jgi:iron(III) transport system permease protein